MDAGTRSTDRHQAQTGAPFARQRFSFILALARMAMSPGHRRGDFQRIVAARTTDAVVAVVRTMSAFPAHRALFGIEPHGRIKPQAIGSAGVMDAEVFAVSHFIQSFTARRVIPARPVWRVFLLLLFRL